MKKRNTTLFCRVYNKPIDCLNLDVNLFTLSTKSVFVCVCERKRLCVVWLWSKRDGRDKVETVVIRFKKCDNETYAFRTSRNSNKTMVPHKKKQNVYKEWVKLENVVAASFSICYIYEIDKCYTLSRSQSVSMFLPFSVRVVCLLRDFNN